MRRLDHQAEFDEYMELLRLEYKRQRDFMKLLDGMEWLKHLRQVVVYASDQNKRVKGNRDLANRVGKPWDEREDEELTERFDAGWNVADLAKHHQRTRGAIRARLVRLGRIENRRDA